MTRSNMARQRQGAAAAGALSVIWAVFLLAGCASQESKQAAVQEHAAQLIRAADLQREIGQTEKASQLLKEAADRIPSSILPWQKTADLYFDAGDYGAAMQAANEVLRREPDNDPALYLLIRCGLAISTGAVRNLRPNSQAPVELKAETESLMTALREQVGIRIRDMPPAQEKAVSAVSTRSRAFSSRGAAVPGNVQPGATKDPFRLLK